MLFYGFSARFCIQCQVSSISICFWYRGEFSCLRVIFQRFLLEINQHFTVTVVSVESIVGESAVRSYIAFCFPHAMPNAAQPAPVNRYARSVSFTCRLARCECSSRSSPTRRDQTPCRKASPRYRLTVKTFHHKEIKKQQCDNYNRNYYRRCNKIVSYEFIWIRRTCDYI